MLSFTTKQAPVYLVGLALFFGISFSRGSISSDAAAWRATLDCRNTDKGVRRLVQQMLGDT